MIVMTSSARAAVGATVLLARGRTAVGRTLGTTVGATVLLAGGGATVGRTLGTPVGTLVGAALRTTVRATVGAAVLVTGSRATVGRALEAAAAGGLHVVVVECHGCSLGCAAPPPAGSVVQRVVPHARSSLTTP